MLELTGYVGIDGVRGSVGIISILELMEYVGINGVRGYVGIIIMLELRIRPVVFVYEPKNCSFTHCAMHTYC